MGWWKAACGEQCDPPGSIVNGSVCDLNCTTGCGNGIVSGTEQCDDGNTNNNDACKNDCTPNVCGDGVVYRAVEQCDHGALNGTPGDACSATCTLPPRTASGQLAAGGTLTTDIEGDGATAGAPVETWVTSPLAGSVSIEEGGPDPTSPSGYAFLGYSVHVTVPSSTADNPILLVFEIHSSLLPAGSDQTRGGDVEERGVGGDCDGGTSAASPDPCIASRTLTANGNLRVSIRSSTASYWGGVAPLHDARVVPRRQISLRIPANKLSVTTKALVRVRNMDRVKSGPEAQHPDSTERDQRRLPAGAGRRRAGLLPAATVQPGYRDAGAAAHGHGAAAPGGVALCIPSGQLAAAVHDQAERGGAGGRQRRPDAGRQYDHGADYGNDTLKHVSVRGVEISNGHRSELESAAMSP